MDKCIDLNCKTRECDYIRDMIEQYVEEPCYIKSCPDKRQEYINQAQRNPEIDIIMETQSNKLLAIEVKSIILSDKELEMNMDALMKLISDKLEKDVRDKFDIHIEVRRKPSIVFKRINQFIEEFNRDNRNRKFENKYVFIEFTDKNKLYERKTTEFKNMNSKDAQFKAIIYDYDGQIFYCYLPDTEDYKIQNILSNSYKIDNEILRKVKTDSVAFKNYDENYEKIFFFNIQFSNIVDNILDGPKYEVFKEQILRNFDNVLSELETEEPITFILNYNFLDKEEIAKVYKTI